MADGERDVTIRLNVVRGNIEPINLEEIKNATATFHDLAKAEKTATEQQKELAASVKNVNEVVKEQVTANEQLAKSGTGSANQITQANNESNKQQLDNINVFNREKMFASERAAAFERKQIQIEADDRKRFIEEARQRTEADDKHRAEVTQRRIDREKAAYDATKKFNTPEGIEESKALTARRGLTEPGSGDAPYKPPVGPSGPNNPSKIDLSSISAEMEAKATANIEAAVDERTELREKEGKESSKAAQKSANEQVEFEKWANDKIITSRSALNAQRVREEEEAAEAAENAAERLPRAYKTATDGILGTVAATGKLSLHIAQLAGAGEKDTQKLAQAFVEIQAKIGLINDAKQLFGGIEKTIGAFARLGELTGIIRTQQTAVAAATATSAVAQAGLATATGATAVAQGTVATATTASTVATGGLAAATGVVVAEQGALAVATTATTGATVGLAGAVTAVQVAMGPIGLAMAAVAAAAAVLYAIWTAADIAANSYGESAEDIEKRKLATQKGYQEAQKQILQNMESESSALGVQLSILNSQWDMKKLLAGETKMSAQEIKAQHDEQQGVLAQKADKDFRREGEKIFNTDEDKKAQEDIDTRKQAAREKTAAARQEAKDADNWVTPISSLIAQRGLNAANEEEQKIGEEQEQHNIKTSRRQVDRVTSTPTVGGVPVNQAEFENDFAQLPANKRDEGEAFLESMIGSAQTAQQTTMQSYNELQQRGISAKANLPQLERDVIANGEFGAEQTLAERSQTTGGQNARANAERALERYDKAQKESDAATNDKDRQVAEAAKETAAKAAETALREKDLVGKDTEGFVSASRNKDYSKNLRNQLADDEKIDSGEETAATENRKKLEQIRDTAKNDIAAIPELLKELEATMKAQSDGIKALSQMVTNLNST